MSEGVKEKRPQPPVQPLFLILPGSISRKDIRRAQLQCGICIVECKEPEKARYSEPPIGRNITDQARAALSLTRMILRAGNNQSSFNKADLVKWFVDNLLNWEDRPDEVSRVPRK